jgi:hypothetical protein
MSFVGSMLNKSRVWSLYLFSFLVELSTPSYVCMYIYTKYVCMCLYVCIRTYFVMQLFNCAFPCICVVGICILCWCWVLLLPFPFLYHLPIYSLLPFSLLSFVPSLPFLYYSETSPPAPLYLGLVRRAFFPSLNYSVLNFSFFLRYFLCPSVRTHYYFPLSPGPTRCNLPWSSNGPWKLPLPFFPYLLPVVVLIFTHLFFVLVLYLLPLSLVPALHLPIQFGVPRHCAWYFYHAIALGYDFPPPFFCYRL